MLDAKINSKNEKGLNMMTQVERSKEEIYASIVARIQTMYHDKLSSAEANEAARNLIDFCQEILDYKINNVRKPENRNK